MTRKILAVAVFASLFSAAMRPTKKPFTGSIAGTVVVEPPRSARRTANRYAGAAPSAHAVQRIPAVVFLKGTIPGSPPPGHVEGPEMAQQDTAFLPAAVFSQVGGSVSFPNGDPFFHNVFSMSSAKRFDLGRYPAGDSREVVFDKSGVIDIYCEVHEFMRGVVIVTENPFHAVVDDDGSFSIGGVPAGDYTLVVWHNEIESVERSVTVTEGGTTRVEVELNR